MRGISVDVRKVMLKTYEAVLTSDPLRKAHQLLQEHDVKRLPVVDDRGMFIGIVDRRDLKERCLVGLIVDADPASARRADAYFEAQLDGLTVADAMTADPLTVSADTSVDVAARLLHQSRMSALPVLDQGRFVGMVNERVVAQLLAGVLGHLRRHAPEMLEASLQATLSGEA